MDRSLALSMLVAAFGQAAWLGAGQGQIVAGVAVGLAAGWLVYLGWMWRHRLDAHVDMFLAMASWGGAAMLWAERSAPCHGLLSPVSPMGAAMGLSVVAMALVSRCMRQAGRARLLLPVLGLDCVLMWLGMEVPMMLAGTLHLRSMPVPMHAAMMAGMLAGMGLEVGLRPLLYRLRFGFARVPDAH